LRCGLQGHRRAAYRARPGRPRDGRAPAGKGAADHLRPASARADQRGSRLVRVPVLRPPRALPRRGRRRCHLPVLPAFHAHRRRLALRAPRPAARPDRPAPRLRPAPVHPRSRPRRGERRRRGLRLLPHARRLGLDQRRPQRGGRRMLTLRPYQQAAIASIYGYFEKESGNPLVVIPTAGGKSLVMAAFIDGVLKAWPDQRVLVVTHVRALIAQNHAGMAGLGPEAPAGASSAGLGRRDAPARILFAGIQSSHGKATRIGHADPVLIDEAHLIPGRSNTMYRRFLNDLQAINPALKVIGLTATPFRLDSGMLHEGENALFTDIAYEVSVRDLIDQGYLSPLISKQTKTRLDVTGVGSRGGEFIARDLEDAVDQDAITRAAVAEVIAHGETRRSWLAFCSGVRHATHVAEEFRRRGVRCATIFGKTPKDERAAIIASFKRGEIRALASMGVLTTGFNAPAVDLIAMLRPTKSAGLYVQMAGRGTRLAEGKENCLVLDFAGNVRRHGPIDLVRPKRPGGPGDGPPPTKICPECGTIVAIAALECLGCGFEFPGREVKLEP